MTNRVPAAFHAARSRMVTGMLTPPGRRRQPAAGRGREQRLHRAGEVQVEVARLRVGRERVEVGGDRVAGRPGRPAR